MATTIHRARFFHGRVIPMAASSSSSKPPADYFADAPVVVSKLVAKVDIEGELLSFEGRLHLDNTAARTWVLTDTLSAANVTLKGHGFDLVEVDGSAVVIEIDDEGAEVMRPHAHISCGDLTPE